MIPLAACPTRTQLEQWREILRRRANAAQDAFEQAWTGEERAPLCEPMLDAREAVEALDTLIAHYEELSL